VTTSHYIKMVNPSVEFPCAEGEFVLTAMQRSGLNVIDVGCRGGGCGACRIQVVDGTYSRRRMSRAHVSEMEELEGVALACRISPTSPLLIAIAPPAVQELFSE